jgi:7,8-dihydroneopterin 2',3'-cyclic phosphate phosphodiesterase
VKNEKSITVYTSTDSLSECQLLNSKLKVLARGIRDRNLREKVVDLLENPTFMINGKKFSGASFDVSPAGLSHHHCYAGGYVEHVVSTVNMAVAMCDCVEKVYHGKVNRDVVVAAVLLHDVFKPATYVQGKAGKCGSARLADYLDHQSLVIAELVRRDFSLEVVHAVAATHGEYGAIRPHTVEALICHLADFADSRLNGEVLDAASYLLRKAVGQELFGLSSKEAFEIVNAKAVEGDDGVRSAFKKIKRARESRKT